MRVSLEWLREFAALPKNVKPAAIAEVLTWRGFEVEQILVQGEGVKGPLVVGKVTSIKPVVSPKKTVRLCQVDLGPKHGRRQIICGAFNFEEGDLVVVAPPGSVITGGVKLSARQVYGHTSEGMIVSAAEVGIGEDHDGILVVSPKEAKVGQDAAPLLGIGDVVFDVAVMPDRGYALSVRGLARELAGAFGVKFKDPAKGRALRPVRDGSISGSTKNKTACDRVVFAKIEAFDAMAPSPAWLVKRLRASGVRPLGLAIDITNYLMLETGQPLHAFDASKVKGAISVRFAKSGEQVETIDHTKRKLSKDDLVIADQKGALSLAGLMGGASSEISQGTRSVVIEAAHFDPVVVAKSGRRHKLSTEASRRFERGVDPALPNVVAAKAVRMIQDLSSGRLTGVSEVDFTKPLPAMRFDLQAPARTVGAEISPAEATKALKSVGCEFVGSTRLRVPTWRPDLTESADLVEEVVRVWGYQRIPSTLPKAQVGRGLNPTQKLRANVAHLLARRGLVEVLNQPFVGEAALADLRINSSDERSQMLAMANPLSEEEPFFRSTLLPNLVATAKRNLNRGNDDYGIFEIGQVTYLANKRERRVHRPALTKRPSKSEVAKVKALLPAQFEVCGGLLYGLRERAGWWGEPKPREWVEAVDLVRDILSENGVSYETEPVEVAPWHPGRAAAFRDLATGALLGIAGELHPGVVKDLCLPVGAGAFEVNLDQVVRSAAPLDSVGAVSVLPIAKEDIALLVDEGVSVAAVETAIKRGAGETLESLRLFDVYRSDSLGRGKKSLAFAMKFRPKSGTLTAEDLAKLRAEVLRSAEKAVGATLRT